MCGLLTMGCLASEAHLIENIQSVRCIDGCAAAQEQHARNDEIDNARK